MEARSIFIAAVCWCTLGNYQQSILLCNRAINLVALGAISGSSLNPDVLNSQAEAYKLKSEYVEARNIQTQNLDKNSVRQDPYFHGYILLNIAEIDLAMDAPKENVQKNIDAARLLFTNMGFNSQIVSCECLQAGLSLREGDHLGANIGFSKSLAVSRGKKNEIVTNCLERLADVSQWNGFHGISTWPVVFLAHSLKSKQNLGINKAFQYLGDLFHAQDDEDTAVTLFTVALGGFTHMDVHRSRAECMLRLGDISKSHGDLLKAIKLWETAKPLFEQSSQGKQVVLIDKRLSTVGEDVQEQHRENLACLAELNAPLGPVENIDNTDLSNIGEGLESFNLCEVELVAR
jgi:tetratricopeptide (TPR) repeat protein